MQLASLRMWAAMFGNVAAIRGACWSLEGEERGAYNVLSAVGSNIGAWIAVATLLADALLAAGREHIFFLPFMAPAESAWVYDG